MPIRKVGSGPAKVSKAYQPLGPVPVKADPWMVMPSTPAKNEPQKTPAPAPPRMESTSPTKRPHPPPKRTSAPVPMIPVEAATNPSPISTPITRKIPISGPPPGPPTRNKLKSPRSVPTLLNGRADGRPGGILATSKSNPALNDQALGPPQPAPGPTPATLASTSNTNIPRLQPHQTPLSSPLNPTQPASKVERRGFFSRLFGFGSSKSKEHKSTKRSSRPISARSMPTAGPTSDPTTRPVSVPISGSTRPPPTVTLGSSTEPTITATSNVVMESDPIFEWSPAMRSQPVPQQSPSTERTSMVQRDAVFKSTSPRRHGVLIKKSPIVQPIDHGRQSFAFTDPSRLPPPQNPGHVRYDSYPQTTHPQGTTSFGSSAQDRTATTNVTNHAIPSNISSPTNNSHAMTAINPPFTPGQQNYGDANRSHDTNRAQHMGAADHSQHVGTGKHYGQPTSHKYGDYSGVQSLVTTPDYALCVVCNTNPRYTYPNTSEPSPYCSDVCKAAAATTTPQAQQATCSYPGCTYPAVMYPVYHHWNYCSELHEYFARKGCLFCRQADENGTQLCNGCDKASKRHAPTIIPVPMDHDAFWYVVDRFTESWTHSTQCPVVQAVYKIASTQQSLDAYLGYRDTLEYYGRFTAQGKRTGNERILWHGTRRGCHLGETGQTTPCVIPGCSLCSVIRGSFDIGKFAASTPTGRFGTGIYTSTKASKADDCSSNDKGVATTYKALLLSNVAAGHECVMRYDDPTLTAPPQGYNSVYGRVGGSLNYDELVVYTNDAIRATWLVMYKRYR